MKLCDYGCGQEAKYQFKNGKWCCSKNISQCPEIKKRMYSSAICPKCNRTFTKNGLSYHLKFCKGKKYCKNCNKEIHPDRKFCSIACSSVINSSLKKKNKYCKHCGKKINSFATYCNNTCYAKYNIEQQIEKWLKGELDGCSKAGHASYVKHYLLKKYDYKCSICGWGEMNPYTNTLPLEVDHIDGVCFNNTPENVTLLCPNCHSLTKTYRGANSGNGKRTYLKKYYI